MRLASAVAGLRGVRRLGVALCGGAVTALSLPPLDFWPALIAGTALLLWLIDGAASSPRIAPRLAKGFLVGWTFGFGYFVLSLYWTGFAFLVDAQEFALLMPLGVAGLPAYLALYWGLAAAASASVWSARGAARPVLLAAALALAEWLRGELFTGFPWNAPGYAAVAFEGLAQLAAFVGLPGLTFLVLLWAGAAAALMEEAAKQPRNVSALIVSAGLVLTAPAAWLLGWSRLPDGSTASVEGVSLRLVQANIAQADKWRPENKDEVLGIYEALSRLPGAERVTHLVWPESALPALVDESAGMRRRLAGLLAPGGHLLMGALRREPKPGGGGSEYSVFNSVLALDGKGDVTGRYDKWRLVPFGEFLPWAEFLEPLGIRKFVPLPGSFAAGEGPRTLRLAATPPVGPLVCYEAIFSRALTQAGDRPAWLLNVTNDAWFGRSAGPHQHLAQARLRSIEQGLPMVRAANTGISAVIDAYGRVEKRLALGAEGVLDARLPEALPATLYARHGDRSLMILLALGLAAVFLLRRLDARSR